MFQLVAGSQRERAARLLPSRTRLHARSARRPERQSICAFGEHNRQYDPPVMTDAPDSRPALDRWLARVFDDQEATRFGSGWASGTIAVFLGVLAVGAVICFHLPATLTSPTVRAVYSLSWIRPLVATVIGAAFLLGLL